MAYGQSSNAAGTGTAATGTAPAGLADGDRLLAMVTKDGSGSAFTPPAGWNLLDSDDQSSPDGRTARIYEIKSVSGTVNLNWTTTNTFAWDVLIVRLTGRHATAAAVIQKTSNTTANATPVSVSLAGVTAAAGDDIVVMLSLDPTSGTETWGFSTITNFTSRQAYAGGDWNACALQTRDNVGAGATGALALTATASGSITSGYVGWVIAVPAGSTDQNLSPSLLTNSNTLYAPTLTPGAVNLAPSLLTNSNTLYGPTLSANYNLTPSLLTNSNTLYAPTLTPGAVDLAPALLTNANTLYAPTVENQGSTQDLAPALLTNTSTLYAPTLTPGSVDLAPSLLTNTSTLYAPTLTPGIVNLSPSLLTNTNTLYAPTLTKLADIVVTWTIPDPLDPAIIGYDIAWDTSSHSVGVWADYPNTATVTPETAATYTIQDLVFGTTYYINIRSHTTGHALDSDPWGEIVWVAGDHALYPSLLTNSNTLYAPTLALDGDLVPALLTNSNTLYAPTLTPGAVNLSPSRLTNASTLYAPTVSGTVDIAPSLLTNSSTLYAPTLGAGAVDLAPALLTNTSTIYAPTVENLDQTTLVSLLTNASIIYAPSISGGETGRPSGGAGHPGGIYWGARKQKKVKSLNKLIDDAIADTLKDLQSKGTPGIKAKTKRIIAKFVEEQKTAAPVSEPIKIDYERLAQDKKALDKLLRLHAQMMRDFEDEQILMLLI